MCALFHLGNCLAFRAGSPCSRLRRGWGRQKAGRAVPGLEPPAFLEQKF